MKSDADFLAANNDTACYKNIIDEMESILGGEGDIKDLLVSIQQRKQAQESVKQGYMTCIKNFILRKNEDDATKDVLLRQKYFELLVEIYLTYIKAVISSKLSSIIAVESNADIKIGYAVTIENIVLERLFGTEEDLRDTIYKTGLLQRDDSSKKLRIILKGEGLLPTIQKYFQAITFPIKSFFVIAQLFKGHIQLTLNQVATESTSLDEKDHQEAIIIQDEIIHIPNIYDSLSIKMWDDIVEDNSLIRLCDVHNKCNDHELLEIFSLENQAEFTNNLKQYVFKNVSS